MNKKLVEKIREEILTWTTLDNNCKLRWIEKQNIIKLAVKIAESVEKKPGGGAKMKIHSLESKVLSLRNVVKIQSSKGNYDLNEYMRGMANGLILAESIMMDTVPEYFKKTYPEKDSFLKYPHKED